MFVILAEELKVEPLAISISRYSVLLLIGTIPHVILTYTLTSIIQGLSTFVPKSDILSFLHL